jgi:hypothetical protein
VSDDLSPQLQEQLNRLAEGESLTVEDEEGQVTYIRPGKPSEPCLEHFYEYSGKEGEYETAICKACSNGVVYDGSKRELRDGKLIFLNE